jgi:hypothetical protein
MKKLFVLLLGVVLSIGLVGCNSPLENTEKAYYVTGQFASWGDVLVADSAFTMEAIAKNDERVASIKDDLSDVEFLYLKEIVLSADAAGWDVTYKIDGTETVLDGNLTVKIIRTAFDDHDMVDWWAQSPESGEITNLTPATLYIPPFVEENVDQAGGWNDNPVALSAGTYYAVFAEMEDNSRALGLIAVE